VRGRAHPRSAPAIPLLLALAGTFAVACSRIPAPVRAEPSIVPEAPEASTATGATWTYDVAATQGGVELSIDAAFPAGPEAPSSPRSSSRSGARCHPYVADVERRVEDGWKPIERTGEAWKVPATTSGTVRIRYRFELARAASDHDDFRVARATGNAIEAPASTWLLRPSKAPPGTRFVLRVTSAPGDNFVTGLLQVGEDRDACGGLAADMGMLPFAAFGALRVHELEDGAVLAAILPGKLDAEEDLLAWIRDAGRAVRGFYGRIPIPVSPSSCGRCGEAPSASGRRWAARERGSRSTSAGTRRARASATTGSSCTR
jgi:hypothetical protein